MNDGTLVMRDGTEVAYRDHGGTGPGLVLLHGGGANLESMDQYAERLGAQRRAVAMDARCCGQSGDPAHFRLADVADDVQEVATVLDLGVIDVVGHSMGGFVAGLHATRHHPRRIVSIDGFGPGTVSSGSDADRDEFRAFQAAMKASFFAMTAPPETGDRAWRDQQVEQLCEVLPAIGYTAPNVRRMAERNFVAMADGSFRRHPARRLFENAFDDEGGLDVLRMYRHVRCPTLLIRCTESGAPPVLALELDALAGANPLVDVRSVPLTHLAPAWDALDLVADLVAEFLRE